MRNQPVSCKDCPLYRVGKGFVPGTAPERPVMLVQGEAPGVTEAMESAPFVGRSGYWVRKNILEVAGVAPELCGFDNTLRCLPPKTGADGDAYPKAAKGVRAACEAHCRQYDTWARYPGVPVLLLGGNALRQRLGVGPVTRWHGHVEAREFCPACGSDFLPPGAPCACKAPGERVSRAVGATFHPSAVLRNPNLLPVTVAEIRNLERIARTGPETRPEVRHETPFPALESLPTTAPFVCDLEWDGGGVVTTVGVALDAHAAYSTHDVPGALRWVRAAMGAGHPIVGHNIVDADLPNIGTPPDWGRVYDTMLMAHLVHPHLAGASGEGGDKDTGVGLLGLGDQVRMYFGVPNWKQDTSDLLAYNGLDCAYNFRLYEALRRDLAVTRQEHLLLKQTLLAYAARRMARRGLRVDSERARVMQTGQTERRETRRAELPFNPNSPKQVREWFARRGIVLPNTTADTLRKCAEAHPEIPELQPLVALKADWKSLSTWFDAEAIESGWLYPRFHVTGTMVARFSSSGPNFQNLPPALRCLVLPPDPDMRWVTFDYSQIENRIVAWFAGDVFEDYRTMAARMFGCRPEDVTGPQRQRAKVTVLATVYGEGVANLALRLFGNKSRGAMNEARVLRAAFFAACSGIRQWHLRLSAQMEAGRIQLRNPFGRWRCVYAQNAHERLKRAAHFLGCSTAADLINQRLLDVERETGLLPGLIVHDELAYAVPRGATGDRLADRIRAIMTAPVAELNGLAIPVEGKTGLNYGKQSETNPEGLRPLATENSCTPSLVV